MKATKETLSPTRVKLTVEVPFDELKPSLEATYRKLARQVRVSGFRPGKVPPRILDQRLGRGVILDEAVQEALPQLYSEAVQAEEVDVLSRPEVDITEFADGGQLVFTAEVDVRPEVTLPEFSELEITVDAVEVTDEQVEEQLGALRDRFAVLTPVERAVQAGDYVSLDLSAEADGTPIDGAEATGLSYEVGSGNLVEGLDDAIIGATDGETRTFTTELLSGEQAGQPAQVTATVRGVKEKELPALDDDFATTASEFDTLDELRADIRTRLEQSRRTEQVGQAREKLLESLLERVEVPVPGSLLAGEIEAREHRLSRELEYIGTDRPSYLETLGQTEEEFDAEVRESAGKAIRSQFILDAVIDAESIGIDQGELMEQLILRAQRSGVQPDVYAQQLAQGEGLTALMADVLRTKALFLLLENAKVVDGAGTPVELALPARSQPDTDADADHDRDVTVAAEAVAPGDGDATVEPVEPVEAETDGNG
ncbi:FKBP-type peptidyl-prolyl cis-trans isomerase (trigger factor) [Frankia casuarinae]|uniref:Trigger factor n=1 Tax=Frankia casuarinae (strain DSM 45818 / CECT 9043 / HFP020203 / CcI3) TaxID=106370 RepID=TIG_FRACC|nr:MULTISPECIES: trigger factor [Frankia]Q2JDR0.1 RecName: Full=Trigger factor; Short=TF; AltName: Full=PPIase [Frankia casuarinae]ABD10582.1 trigger factor [Frankia casuarinae]ESZ99688.1 FKBP-type peptidyl-prolyl cis-trans isomerase (trigger factor) [Frankia sp. CcI6]EYT89697.1 FKBP-type peptidyl-prolyl cis-trans isomerase (trigger factor) [Frankia casuarinae]KDA40465.1 FKBP-type peptidyl-prolyl cis-trans isomerase (trigger factor) [Frankia sp. BMG5.23]KEZ36867.1 trigger factor [Frankia sp. 